MNKETKDQIAREAESLYPDIGEDGVNEYMFSKDEIKDIQRLSYIAGAETWAERGEVLKEALETLNKELDYFWNSSRTISSRKIIPETIKRAICAAQKECAEALSNYNNHK